MHGSFFMKPVAATEGLWSHQSFPWKILWAEDPEKLQQETDVMDMSCSLE